VFVKLTASGLNVEPGIKPTGTLDDLFVKSSLLFVGPTASGEALGPLRRAAILTVP
jgi:hypothetical protein